MNIEEKIGDIEVCDFSGKTIERMEPRIVLTNLMKHNPHQYYRDNIKIKTTEVPKVLSQLNSKENSNSQKEKVGDLSLYCNHKSEEYVEIKTKNYTGKRNIEIRRKNINVCKECAKMLKDWIKEYNTNTKYWSKKGICVKITKIGKETVFSDKIINDEYLIVLHYENSVYVEVKNLHTLKELIKSPKEKKNEYNQLSINNPLADSSSSCLVCGHEIGNSVYYTIDNKVCVHNYCMDTLTEELDKVIEKNPNLIVSRYV